MLYSFNPPEAVLRLPKEPKRDPLYPFGLISFSSDEYDAYTRNVVAHVLKHFTHFSIGPMLDCSVRCFVDSAGSIYNYRIFEISGNDEFDKKVLDTLILALPLPAVPESLQKNKWTKAPIALRFRSDGWIIPYIEPDPNQSEWIKASEDPSPDEQLKEVDKSTKASKKVIDPALEPWIVSVSQKAVGAWNVAGS